MSTPVDCSPDGDLVTQLQQIENSAISKAIQNQATDEMKRSEGEEVLNWKEYAEPRPWEVYSSEPAWVSTVRFLEEPTDVPLYTEIPSSPKHTPRCDFWIEEESPPCALQPLELEPLEWPAPLEPSPGLDQFLAHTTPAHTLLFFNQKGNKSEMVEKGGVSKQRQRKDTVTIRKEKVLEEVARSLGVVAAAGMRRRPNLKR